jgi:hypothetical protein
MVCSYVGTGIGTMIYILMWVFEHYAPVRTVSSGEGTMMVGRLVEREGFEVRMLLQSRVYIETS